MSEPTDNEKKFSKSTEVYQPQSLAKGLEPSAQQQAAETTAIVLAAREKALVEARYIVAMKQPRLIDKVRAGLLHECDRTSFAKAARYHKPVGNGIEGASIRFAEAAIQAMGNITVETPTITEDDEKRVMRVTVTDVERNASYSQDIVVRKAVERNFPAKDAVVLRSRTNSKGKTVYLIEATDDDILNKQNALISKAIRTLGLRLVPGWLVDECMDRVIATLKKADEADPDAAKHKLFDAFASIGVPVDKLMEWLGHDGKVLQPKERNTLLGIYNAIRDGETTWREVMDAKAAEKDEKQEPKTQPTPGSTPLKEAIGAGSAASVAPVAQPSPSSTSAVPGPVAGKK